MSTSLVRPDDIDAVDANDLLDSFLQQNLDVIVNKREERLRKDWASERRKQITHQYRARAESAYQQMWDACSRTKLSHEFNRIDVRGTSVDMCGICSYHKGQMKSVAADMNNDLVQAMTTKLIDLDLKAGVLVWPTPDEMPERLLKHEENGKDRGKKNRWR